MTNWFSKIFSLSSKKVTKDYLPQQIKKTETAQIATELKAEIGNKVAHATKPKGPSIASKLDYGKWYYGVDTKAKPVVKKIPGGIEKRYPCKDGGEVVVTYVSRGDKSSSLTIAKTGNPKDVGRGDWYKSFYSDTAVKHYKNRFGDDAIRVVKKKGAQKQILSCYNGRLTEDVHVPLKRWELIKEKFGFNNGKKVCYVNPWNPDDFKRFID